MSELRSVLDDMATTDTHVLGAEDLAGLIVEALHGQQQLEVLVARWTATLSEREGHQDLGYRSPTTFLMHRGRLSAGHASQVVARGNAAQRAPGAHTAWADGRLSTDQATSMFEVADAVPDQYPDAEPRLVEIVEGLSVKDTRKTVEYWRQSVDGPGDLNGEAQQVRRGVSLSKTIGGMHYLSGWMTSLAGETLRTGLEALMPPPAETDTRTPRQRRHDAFEELARQWLETGDTPSMGGEKPHLMVLTDIEGLRGIAGGLHETIDGTVLNVEDIRRIGCDASISRIIIGPGSEILDVGRKTRVWTTAQRRAVVARDRHCQGSGCDAPPHHCDIHHIDHWANGGTTSVDKGKLLCRPCHSNEHIKQASERRP